ncbi:hypothetical protein EV356DRAFT_532034 [Viridothelium virens]|uniref:Uncharacterized protein n=1 Tax=Viridothelium virens TaxID=1048519 RepID=A0A6A6HBS9_VIRVR|nr:hypothetical protein EV356DRAFT_532034 [Viridothelium virens]
MASNTTLTEKDMRNLALTWQCFIGGEPAVDYTKFAHLAGYTEGSARTTLGSLRRKIKNLIANPDQLDAAGATEPYSGVSGSGSSNNVGSSGGSGGGGGGKKRSRKSAAAGEEDGEEEAAPKKQRKKQQGNGGRAPRKTKKEREMEAEARRAMDGGEDDGENADGDEGKVAVVKEEIEDEEFMI